MLVCKRFSVFLENWSEEFKNDGDSRGYNSLYFIDEESGWAVGESGLITKYSLNNGWELQPLVTSLPLNKVFFVDRDHSVTGLNGFNSFPF